MVTTVHDDDLYAQFLLKPSAEMLSTAEVLRTFVDPADIEQFWLREYLQGFVDAGAGKVKFVKGRSGAGKTHWLRHFAVTAEREGYLSIHVDAWMQRLASIDELYRAVARAVPWDDLLSGCTLTMIRDHMGYPDFEQPVSQFRTWAETSQSRNPVSLMNDIRQAADRFVRDLDIYSALKEPLRASLVRRTGGELADESILLGWLSGNRLSRQEKKAIFVSANIDRKNARAILLSLAALVRLAGYKGLVILVDNLQVMSHTSRREGIPYYTRTTRDQAYEMIRELIDESHRAPWIFLVFAGDNDLFENQKTGFAAYPALWLRIQSEIMTAQVNRFADILDLDRLWREEDLRQLKASWRMRVADVELSGALASVQPDAWGLSWSSVRRMVVTVLADASREGAGQPSDLRSPAMRDHPWSANGGL